MNKSFLWSVRNIDREIDKLCEKYEALGYSLLPSGIRYDKDKVQSTPEDTMAEIISQRLELDKQITEKRKLRGELINEIYDAIELLQDDRAQNILIKYFVSGKSLRTIAIEMGISKSGAHKIYKKALQNFEEE